ncbi:MAG TPA: hypothetical protein VFV50_08835 [Bdellovibrionales bacterium]|nr:hypothetical protein [Bdellovibrionales bacterium]
MNDDELERAEAALKTGIERRLAGKRLFAGPKGLLLLKNCESLKLDEIKSNSFPEKISERFEVDVTLQLKGATKTDALGVQAVLRVRPGPADGEGRHFELSELKFSNEALSLEDHCRDMRRNSRLFASVQAREIVIGMPEAAVKASWGEWRTRAARNDGSTVLQYEGREVRLRGGLVESWSIAPSGRAE